MITQPKFFKEENNDQAEEFVKCLPLGVQTSFRKMAPAIVTAEQLRVLPLIGENLFNRAAEYYADSEHTEHVQSDILDQLVELLQMAVVRLACWDSFDEIAVMMTDAGISDNQGERRVYRYQADALKNTLYRQGYEYMNKVLELCTSNISDLPEFESSTYYTVRSNSIIHSMADFEKHISINGDFRVFAKLREWISMAENMELDFRIGSSLKETLKTHAETTPYSTVMQYVVAFVAHWAMAEAAPFLHLVASPRGMMVESEESNNGGKVTNSASPEQVLAFSEQHRKIAERYIGQAVTYCKRNIDIFPEIAEIGTDSDTEHGADIVNNDDHKTFLVL